MEIPESYHGREQTWLKHQVLEGYLQAWAMKIASFANTLWFVDCFAGPWKASDAALQDTSVAIALRALNEAHATWSARGRAGHLQAKAIFVEANRHAYGRLESFVAEHRGVVEATTIHGVFGERVARIQETIGQEPAFLFVDPTGWKGVAMNAISPLAQAPRRDFMVNVMYDHVNRFKDDPRDFLREQMGEFFGLAPGELEPGLDEEALMKLYRARIKETCGAVYVADLAVPVPTRNRTYFRLVLGTSHPLGLRLFRDTEHTVAGRKAANARAGARQRENERGGQVSLVPQPVAPEDHHYTALREHGREQVRVYLPKLLEREGPQRFDVLWPRVLQVCHLTHAELADCVGAMAEEGAIVVERGRRPGSGIRDGDVIRRG